MVDEMKREKSLMNAIATAKRKIGKCGYSYYELVEDVATSYCLRKDEILKLGESLEKYCRKHWLYMDVVNAQYKRYDTIKGVDEM